MIPISARAPAFRPLERDLASPLQLHQIAGHGSSILERAGAEADGGRGVQADGYRAWRARPMSRRQRDDMVILAHIREQRRLSLGSYMERNRPTFEERVWRAKWKISWPMRPAYST